MLFQTMRSGFTLGQAVRGLCRVARHLDLKPSRDSITSTFKMITSSSRGGCGKWCMFDHDWRFGGGLPRPVADPLILRDGCNGGAAALRVLRAARGAANRTASPASRAASPAHSAATPNQSPQRVYTVAGPSTTGTVPIR